MSRRCSVCDHPRRREIDRALVAGSSLTQTAKVYDLSVSALFRHRKEHLAALLEKAKECSLGSEAQDLVRHRQAVENEESAHALDLRQQLKVVNAACLEVLRQARSDARQTTLLQAVDRIHRQIALQAQLLGGMPQGDTENEPMPSQWALIRQVILEALQPFPDARIAVAEALGTLTDLEAPHAEP